VIVAVSHSDYLTMQADDFRAILTPKGILADLKGLYRRAAWNSEFDYWSL
jgi:hypothetical protein